MEPTQPPIQQPVQNPIQVPSLQPEPNYLKTIIFSVLIIITLSLVTYLIFQNQKLQKQVLNPPVSPTIQVPSPTPKTVSSISIPSDETAGWKTYNSQTLKISFKLPPELSNELGKIEEIIVPGQKGSSFCFISSSKKYCDINLNFNIGTTSIDFEEGRGGSFLDLQGYILKDGKYLGKFVQGNTFVIKNDLVNENTNENGIKILKIIGQNNSTGEYRGPIAGTPGEGMIGALINIPNSSVYQGFAIQMKLTDKFTDKLFDQILSTFKFIDIKQGETSLPSGWTYYKYSTCNIDVPIPPEKLDVDNRTWKTEIRPNYDLLGFFKGNEVIVIHRNPEEASGFISGMVEVACGQTNDSLIKLNTDFHSYLTLQTPQNTSSDFLIELTANNDVTMWGTTSKEMTFAGGMFDPKQKYYLFVNSNRWYLITKKSDSSNPEINQQTDQIFNLLKFTNTI